MRWSTAVVAVGALALSLAGCSDSTLAVARADAERAEIVERTLALQARVLAAGQMTEAQRIELEEITQDIVEWRERTGRTDLTVSSSRPAQTDGTAALISRGPPQPTCPPCPPVKVVGTTICFLITGWCDTANGLARGCAYQCIGT